MFCVLPMFLQVGVLNQLAKTAKFETNKSYFVKSFSVGKSFWTCMFISFVCVCVVCTILYILTYWNVCKDVCPCRVACVGLTFLGNCRLFHRQEFIWFLVKLVSYRKGLTTCFRLHKWAFPHEGTQGGHDPPRRYDPQHFSVVENNTTQRPKRSAGRTSPGG